jgi:hypothetical protein
MTPDLIKRTAEAASAAPQQWALFLKEFESYSDGLTRELLKVSRKDFAKQQGRAVHAAQLLDLFRNARERAQKLTP